MPKTTRKYPTKKKTTTRQGKTEYQRLFMKNNRHEKKILKHKIQSNQEKVQLLRKQFPDAYTYIFGRKTQKRKRGKK